MKNLMLLAALAVSVTACAQGPQPAMGGGTPRPGTPDVSSAGASSQGMPQTANSLPAGDRVNAPLASPTGSVSTTRTR